MNPDRFHSRLPVWPIWIAILAAGLNAADELWYFARQGVALDRTGALHGIAFAAFAFTFWAFLRVRRNVVRSPTVEVSDERICHGLSFRAWAGRKQLRMQDVVEILPAPPNRIELLLASGKRVGIPLAEVARAERDAVRDAIERRLAARRR